MDAFTIRNLREHTGGPFDEELVTNGLCIALAIELYEQEVLSLGKAARLAGLPVETFIEKLGAAGVPAVRYSADELSKEMDGLGYTHRSSR